MNRPMISVIAVALFTAGCLQPADSQQTGADPDTVPDDQVNLDSIKPIAMESCHYVDVTGDTILPSSATKPESWQQENKLLQYSVETFHCAKISAGSLEATNATIIFETISGNAIPAGCRDRVDDAWIVRTIQAIWASNHSLRIELEQIFRTPVLHVSEIELEIRDLPQLSSITLSGDEGLEMVRTGAYGYSPQQEGQAQNAFFWETNSSVGIFSWSTDVIRSNWDQQGGPGEGPARPLAPDPGFGHWFFSVQQGDINAVPEIQEDYFCGGPSS